MKLIGTLKRKIANTKHRIEHIRFMAAVAIDAMIFQYETRMMMKDAEMAQADVDQFTDDVEILDENLHIVLHDAELADPVEFQTAHYSDYGMDMLSIGDTDNRTHAPDVGIDGANISVSDGDDDPWTSDFYHRD